MVARESGNHFYFLYFQVMIKYFIPLLLFTLPTLVFSQEEKTNRLNDMGQKTDYWIVLDQDGNKKYEGFFLEGHPVGTLTRYYPDGVVKAIMDHDSTGVNVEAKIYDELGKLWAQGQYIKQLKEGKWNYYGSQGEVLIEINYKADQINGQAIRYFVNGKIMEKTNWSDNAMHGIQQIFNEQGDKTTEIYYRNNQMDGAYLVFYPGGELAVKGHYHQNLKEGEWIYYFINGKIDYSLTYSEGKPLNSEILDQRQKEVFDQYEKNRNLVKDPIMYLKDPESYFRK